MLSCKSVRKEAIQIVGNFCAPASQSKNQEQKVQDYPTGLDIVRNGLGIALIFIAGGVMLCGGSLMKFLLEIIKETPNRNYQEVRTLESADSPDNTVREETDFSARMEYETELSAI